MGTKKILGCLAKFWVNGHCLSEKCRNFGVLWASDHVKNGKLFQNVIKVKIYAYAHMNIKYLDFSKDFWTLGTDKVMKIQENGIILKKARSFYSKFC